MRPRLSLRARLTALYAGLFLAAGVLLLGVSYALVARSLTDDAAQLERIAVEQFGIDEGVAAEQELRSAVREQVADGALADLRWQYGLALVGITGLALLLGWAASGRALRPIREITETAQRISEHRLDQRIGLEGPDDELRRLADTIDGMLARLDAAFESQRRFVANASHELRTPLTVMRAEIDVALSNPDPDPDELRGMALTVREATRRSEHLIESLLTLARSDAGSLRREAVDLAAAARLAIDELAVEVRERRLQVRAILQTAPAAGDQRLLERLVANLAQNAVRHNHPGGFVELSTERTGDAVSVRVSNSGPLLRTSHEDRLLQPFERDEATSGDEHGIGLGLSIVRSVVRAHDGELRLAPREGGGLEVEVELPAARTRGSVAGGARSRLDGELTPDAYAVGGR
jgi:signal transduction histidine kinase